MAEEREDSKLLEVPKEDMTIEELEQEIAGIKAEGEKRQKEEEAEIQNVLSEMTEKELKALKKETLARVDTFHKSRANYPEIAGKDIRELGGESLTEAHIRGIRDQVLLERCLGGKS